MSRLSVLAAHGREGSKQKFAMPHCAVPCEAPNRPDQGNKMESSEYVDSPSVLKEKVKMLADMLRRSRFTSVYAGAGLSRSAGIPDYGTKASGSLAAVTPALANVRDAQPTFSHFSITALAKAELVHVFVQQNHDGLPQKGGFPQAKMNEIHGAWYDPSNPVVQFSGKLRGDLFEWLLEVEDKTDLCLCVGTSLSGMNADRVAETPTTKPRACIGTVIVNLQRTRLDEACALRIWARLDDVFKLLMAELEIAVPTKPVKLPPSLERMGDVFVDLPYNKTGARDESKRMELDLRQGAKVRIAVAEACNAGEEARVIGRDKEGNYVLQFTGGMRRVLGRWWVIGAARGTVGHLPVTNLKPVVRDAPSSGGVAGASVDVPTRTASGARSDDADVTETTTTTTTTTNSSDDEIEAPAPTAPVVPVSASTPAPALTPSLPSTLTILQSHELRGRRDGEEGNVHQWSLYLPPGSERYVSKVTYTLHPTFRDPVVCVSSAPFGISRVGWGVFQVGIEVELKGGVVRQGKHMLTFAGEGENVGECVIRV